MPALDVSGLVSSVLSLLGAITLALPIAWERERTTGVLGLRTFPLVSLASCGYVMLATAVAGSSGEAQARIIQGLMTGMGFIGGGAILKEHGSVRGTATAASIWATGAIGASVGYARYEIAVAISLLNILALLLLTPLERRISRRPGSGAEDE
jgi:putative Mg2+ transporter-C (MgtC) family protein